MTDTPCFCSAAALGFAALLMPNRHLMSPEWGGEAGTLPAYNFLGLRTNAAKAGGIQNAAPGGLW